jgi:hypothetical protein
LVSRRMFIRMMLVLVCVSQYICCCLPYIASLTWRRCLFQSLNPLCADMTCRAWVRVGNNPWFTTASDVSMCTSEEFFAMFKDGTIFSGRKPHVRASVMEDLHLRCPLLIPPCYIVQGAIPIPVVGDGARPSEAQLQVEAMLPYDFNNRPACESTATTHVCTITNARYYYIVVAPTTSAPVGVPVVLAPIVDPLLLSGDYRPYVWTCLMRTLMNVTSGLLPSPTCVRLRLRTQCTM